MLIPCVYRLCWPNWSTLSDVNISNNKYYHIHSNSTSINMSGGSHEPSSLPPVPPSHTIHSITMQLCGQTNVNTVVPLDSNTLWLEHFPIRTHLANKFWPPIRTRPLNSNTKTRGGRCRLPASRQVLLACHRCEHLSLLQLVNGFQVTPAPSCLGYSSPQPWSLPT